MAQLNDATEKPNGVTFGSFGENQDSDKSKPIYIEEEEEQQQITLDAVIRRLITDILFPESGSGFESADLLNRIKVSVSQNLPLVRDASRNTSRDLLLWTRRGSAFRALLVVSVGTIALLAVTGFLVFTLFFLVATFNAIAISLLISLAAAGGFLALFFACVTAIYISALSIAAFVVSTATISAILAALVVAGWIGFFYTVWLVTKKCIDLAKHSLSITGSAISAYSSSRHAESQYAPVSTSD